MKIDSHQHFWRYTPTDFGWIGDDMKSLRRNYFPIDLEEDICKAGIGGTIAVQAQHTLAETRWLLELAEEAPFIKGVVGWVDLCALDVDKQIRYFKRFEKFVGVRHIVQGEADQNYLLRPEFSRGIKALQYHNLTYDILIYPEQLRSAIQLVEQFPDMRFILDHIAKPNIRKNIVSPWKEEIGELAQHPNVYCKLSGMVTEADWKRWHPELFRPYLDIVCQAFGPAKLMIGSDWPVCTVAGTYGAIMNIVVDYFTGFSAAEQTAILGGNAATVYDLNIK
jgi:L-fuconolactonase